MIVNVYINRFAIVIKIIVYIHLFAIVIVLVFCTYPYVIFHFLATIMHIYE